MGVHRGAVDVEEILHHLLCGHIAHHSLFLQVSDKGLLLFWGIERAVGIVSAHQVVGNVVGGVKFVVFIISKTENQK